MSLAHQSVLFCAIGALTIAPCVFGEMPEYTTDSEGDRKSLGSPEFTGDMKKTWAHSPIHIDGDVLQIQGHPVMEAWEHPYMRRLAEIATSFGGNVLECGHGMAISSTYIQEKATVPVASHHIIEANVNVAARADAWSAKMPRPVVVHRGYTWDVSPSLKSGFFDGILYDTYPLEKGKAGKHHLDFISEAARLLRPGGVFTYFSNDADGLAAEETRVLDAAGFDCTTAKVPTDTPEDCKYWRHKYLIAPTCIKRGSDTKAEL